jgi:leukotriene-A4 hydrolase
MRNAGNRGARSIIPMKVLSMRAIALLLALAVAACTPAGQPETAAPAAERMVAPILMSDDARDPYSYAQPQIARVTHVALDLTLDFANRSVAGTATLDIDAGPSSNTGSSATVVLDSKGLDISRVVDAQGRDLAFTVGANDPDKGAPVTVPLGYSRRITVHYRATNADALQWLSPEQTAGGRHPYLLSQGQPTLNRTWIPTQDSPGIRQTWEAVIRAPAPLTVVMSGERLSRQGEPAANNMRAFRFRMDRPVAPYLIAIAAGDIVFRELGPRSGVWTEPAMIDAAVAELGDTERMISAAERLYGPYRWGRYDMIVLPPSFPYGGMENPTLTFLTPTFIAGDRSLNGLVAHELAHSWSGNLVTNATWSDNWLNEGFTSYFENRIMEELYGIRRAAQEEALSFADMEAAIAEHGATANITRLRLPPGEDGPDGGASGIIYDKGATFLRTVERIVGRQRFDAWLRSWFDRHAFQPATTAMLLADMRANLVRGDAALERTLMLEEWLYAPGLPSNVRRPDPAAFAEVDRAIAAYGSTGIVDPASWASWTTAERLRFFDRLPRQRTAAQLAALDRDLGLSRVGNNEVLFAWLNLAMANRYDPAVPTTEAFLARVGRRKFVLPLFRTLWAQGEWGQPIARRIYARTRAGYHAVTRGSVDGVVGVP